MGWERYLGPNHSGEAPTDFEIHRAQMRNYDDYMERAESVGISGSFSSGFTYSGESTGRGGGHVSVAGPHVMAEYADDGKLSFRVSDDLIGLDELPRGFGQLAFSDVMAPETRVWRFAGIDILPNPGFSDWEEGFEARYGDSLWAELLVPAQIAADIGHTAGLRVDGAAVYRDTIGRVAPYLDDARWGDAKQAGKSWLEGVLSPSRSWEVSPLPGSGLATGADGHAYRTGGGF